MNVAANPRVLIADDHAPTRAGVRMALERDGIEVCAEVANASDAVEAALRERPDLCLLDVHMPGGGPSAASKITSHLPGTTVVMLTVSRENADVLESLRRGAVGYLLKDMNPASLPVAVRAALGGEGVLPRALAAGLIEELRHRPEPRRVMGLARDRPALSAREWEILEMLAEGAGTAEIARRLFLSQVTVRRHVSSILGKLGVSSREEAVRLIRGEDPDD
ncbi:MAG TPA: response regulator transcription factor [Thermoleophilaceae bacterium]|nr:response regulator transcription factor [Thermoleophilaceae bacterium]